MSLTLSSPMPNDDEPHAETESMDSIIFYFEDGGDTTIRPTRVPGLQVPPKPPTSPTTDDSEVKP